MPRESSLVIVGAGVAGLSAALHLAERGLAPLVLEADPRFLGGRLAGGDEIEVDGWRFRDEHGVHAIWSPYRNLQAMLARHGLRPVFVPALEEDWIHKRAGQVRSAAVGSAIRHGWVPAPFHYLNLFLRQRFLTMLDVRDWLSFPQILYGILFAVAVDPLREGQPLGDLRLSDLTRGWPPTLRAFLIGLVRNGLSGRPEEIPLSGYVSFMRFYTVLRRDAWTFSYMPADGGTALVEPLARRVEELGGTILRGRRVTHLERADEGWRVCWEEGKAAPLAPPPAPAGGGEERGVVIAPHLILATDAPSTRTLLDASPQLAGEAAGLYWPRGMPTATIRLWFDREPNGGAEAGILSGDFVLDNFFWLHGLQDPYVRWHRATGGSAIEAHIYGPPELLEEPDAVLLARAISDVQSAWPELRDHRIHQTLRRNPPVHTLFGVGPADRHLGPVTPWPGLYCCGDWVYHPAPAFFLERACATGIAAANEVLRAHGLSEWPLLAYPEPEPLAAWVERLMVGGRRALRKMYRRGGRGTRNPGA
jgi:isorenieratene synthase